MTKPSSDVMQPHKLFCWLSGWTDSYRPPGWCGPWKLQLAHIASGGGDARRVKDDRRAVLPLCPLCHDLHVSDSERYAKKWIAGKEWPTIDASHTLWLKREFDEEYYDTDFLQEYWIGQVPDPVAPPLFWRQMMLRNQGLML